MYPLMMGPRIVCLVIYSSWCAFCCLTAALSLCGGVLEVEAGPGSGSAGAICNESLFDLLGQSEKGVFHMYVVLGGTFEKGNAKLGREFLTLFCGDHLLVEHVALVAHQNLVDVNVRVLLDLCDPIANGFKRATVRHIIDQENALCPPKVRGRNGPKALLSRRIPNLHLDLFVIHLDILDLEINPNRRNEGWGEGIIRIPKQQTRLSNPRISNHEQFHLQIIRLRHDILLYNSRDKL